MLADPLMQYQFEREPGSQKADSKEEERLALQKLIHRLLILQEARRRNITVTEQDFDQTLTALRRRFADVRSFGVWMKERGLDDRSLFDMIRTEMLMRRVMTALVERIRPTEVEAQAYYETHKEDLTIGEEVRLRIIVVKSRKAAEEILAALRKGENFSRLARARSLGLHAAQGGDMGWVSLQTLPSPLQRAVEKLKTDDVGGPLQKSADEFLIVGLEGRRPVRAKSSAEARPEIERRLLHEKQQEAIQTWLKEQENKSKIELFLPPG
jgi:peptidyl-prolyl cis-trans isomerase C/foldase protein PrsA